VAPFLLFILLSWELSWLDSPSAAREAKRFLLELLDADECDCQEVQLRQQVRT
jgi:hypothetical protein